MESPLNDPQPRLPRSTASLQGGLQVCGTTSDAGKSTIVAGLCRVLARQGVSVAPFKGQNMANNSVVTPSGHEIGRAQGFQAFAAGVVPEPAMNPVLLKPTTERASQVVVMGRPWKTLAAAEYHAVKHELLPVVLDALDDLRARYDVVLVEGAGSPAEINLLSEDITNLRIAHEAGLGALLVGDINPGGVFAALYGTVAILPDHLRACIRGLIINKLRGDPALLLDGPAELTRRTSIPIVGVLPWMASTGLDAEDSMALDHPARDPGPPLADGIDIAVIALPRISNFTDFDPLTVEPGVSVRYVRSVGALGDPDLVVIPGSKSTVTDLAWLRTTGIAEALMRRTGPILGICGGYQMLGSVIDDPHHVESGDATTIGLGRLDVRTTFDAAKVTRLWHGTATLNPADSAPSSTTTTPHAPSPLMRVSANGGATRVEGYLIHHGAVLPNSGDVFLTGNAVVAQSHRSVADRWTPDPTVAAVQGVRTGDVFGTTLHGLFEADEFRRSFLSEIAQRRSKRFVSAGRCFADARTAAVDTLADALEQYLDLGAIEAIIAAAAPPGSRKKAAL